MRRILDVVQNSLQHGLEVAVLGNPLPRVGVAIEAREVAAGDLYPDPVPRLEDIAGGPQIDRVAIHSARLHQAGDGS